MVSANGTANGIVWDLALKANQLRAYSAADLSDEIYNSSTVSADALPSSSILKFSVLTVANGDVYVGTSSSLVMFGLKTPPAAPPAAPSSLAATVTTDATAVSLSWTNNETNPANVSAFEIQRSTDDVNFTQVGTTGESQTTFLDTSVAPFTTYYYRVSAGNAAGTSAFSNVATVSTQGQPAVGGGDGLLGKYYAGTNSANFSNTPTFARVDPVIDFDDTDGENNWKFPGSFADTDFEVQWTGELQAQYSEAYTFYTASESGVELFVNGKELINDFTAHGETDDTGAPAIALVAGQSYAIEIVYIQSSSQSGAAMYLYWSSQHTAREIIPQSQLFSGSAPAAPTNLQVAAISGNQTELTWTSNATDEDGYEVDRRLGNSGSFSPVAYPSPASTEYLDTGLTAGQTYTYWVRADNFLADSAESNQVTVVMPSLPADVTHARATSATATSITMAWTPTDNNGTNFRIFRLPGGVDGNPIFVTQLPDTPPETTATYSDTGLLPGQTYAYEIECGNLAGYSAYADFSTQTLTDAPGQLVAVPADSQVTLSWIAPSGAESFNIYRGASPGDESPTPLAMGVEGTSFVDTTAADGTEYYYEVTAVDSGGEAAAVGRGLGHAAGPRLPAVAADRPDGDDAQQRGGPVGLAGAGRGRHLQRLSRHRQRQRSAGCQRRLGAQLLRQRTDRRHDVLLPGHRGESGGRRGTVR